ncbi:metal ABC transporter solute-binding protein, Zn/Mn family [Rhodococcus sp. SGAir0479]|uniref:metal ABC transporter solute-binding protein, Zn/Mn family n=1 Tax=Rhodococcus sp. SGAir0479 TaxID=2567884 RepID=UPI0010CD066A|nr:zinc ABC transporter substrate-binding protein [Rhodococcus sp. SGAir0479]QCQ93595.1 ABC transporter permease [Rhodococcus sp. SGAir0479]
MRKPRQSTVFRSAAATIGAALAAVTLTACGSSPDADGPLRVVASTNVWGSVAQAVAGDRLEVTSIVTEPSADPHSYEASPSDAARISDADLVVLNGGGYDQFVEDVLDSTGAKPTVDAFDLYEERTGTHAAESDEEHAGHSHGAANEHVWYDMPTVDATANAIAEQLGKLDPDGADVYTRNAETFRDRLRGVSETTAAIAAAHRDAPVAQTEPIAYYLLEAAKLKDLTPPAFTGAVENGTDPSPASIAETRQLFSDKKVRVLVYNAQTEDKVTESIRQNAEAAGTPVVEVTETLPEGMDFVQWQTRTAQTLADALNGAS